MLLAFVLLGCPQADTSPDTGGDSGPAIPDDTSADSGLPDGTYSLADAGLIVQGGASYAAGNAVAFVPKPEGPSGVAVAAYFTSRVCLFDAPAPAGIHALDSANTCWSSGGTSEYFGYSMAVGQDLDGDGTADMLVGAIGDRTIAADAGAVYLIGAPSAGGERDAKQSPTVFLGEAGADYAGSTVAFLGDTDGDGIGDVLIGAQGNDGGGGGGGSAYVVRGPFAPGFHLLSEADTIIQGAGPIAQEAAAPPHGTPAGGDDVGVTLDGIGDFNGDGLQDLALGAIGNEIGGVSAGAMGIYLGPLPTGALPFEDADQLYLGDVTTYGTAESVAAGGDLNGDGLADVLAGGALHGPGTTWLVPGPGVAGVTSFTSLPTSFVGEATEDYAGTAAAGAGDVDGDGANDVIIGASARLEYQRAGAAYVVRGPFPAGTLSLADADATWLGETGGDSAGRVVAGGQDADGDGHADMLVGALYNDGGGAFGGAAYLIGWR
jgi:hypothetical protein